MIVGVPKEVKDRENRVSTTPAGVREFVAHGHRVIVERSAGGGSGFSAVTEPWEVTPNPGTLTASSLTIAATTTTLLSGMEVDPAIQAASPRTCQ